MGARALTLTRIDMDEALVSKQIHLLYQPIFSLSDGALRRVEALVRWDHPRFGTMLPAVFLPAFEAEEKLSALTRRIMQRAVSEFTAAGLSSETGLSINLSARDCVDDELPASVEAILEESSVDPAALTFECPVKIDEGDEAAPILRKLGDLGVRLGAEMMGRTEQLADIFAIAHFDEIKTGGRGLLRAARANHAATLSHASDLIAFAEAKGAAVTAVGAEDEAACAALRTVGFHMVQANVLAPAGSLDTVTEQLRNDVRVILGLNERESEEQVKCTDQLCQEDPFRLERVRAQAEAFKRAAERKGDLDDEADFVPDAKAMQNVLAKSFGDAAETHVQPQGADARGQQEALMQAESKAGLLMRPDLAAASLGYGASPLRSSRRRGERAAVIVVEPSESNARALSKEPAVAHAITEVLSSLPSEIQERETWDEDAERAAALDAEVAKTPALSEADADNLPHGLAYSPVSDELADLAARLRPAAPKRNFLQRKYKLRVTHFWPRPWVRAYHRIMGDRRSLSHDQVMDRLGGQSAEENTVPVMTLRADEPGQRFIAPDERALPADEGTHAVENREPLSPSEAGQER
jgi:EAL domain-containing protein (putative c-di-GMP-specific phosphodiesterase class I)